MKKITSCVFSFVCQTSNTIASLTWTASKCREELKSKSYLPADTSITLAGEQYLQFPSFLLLLLLLLLLRLSLSTKFRVHSQSEKAQLLQKLTEQFLELRLERSFQKVHTHTHTHTTVCTRMTYVHVLCVCVCVCIIFVCSSPFQSDAHYAILLFLLDTSQSPTHASYTPPLSVPLPSPAYGGDDFDWLAYLMEGIELPTYSDTDSEVCQRSCDMSCDVSCDVSCD